MAKRRGGTQTKLVQSTRHVATPGKGGDINIFCSSRGNTYVGPPSKIPLYSPSGNAWGDNTYYTIIPVTWQRHGAEQTQQQFHCHSPCDNAWERRTYPTLFATLQRRRSETTDDCIALDVATPLRQKSNDSACSPDGLRGGAGRTIH